MLSAADKSIEIDQGGWLIGARYRRRTPGSARACAHIGSRLIPLRCVCTDRRLSAFAVALVGRRQLGAVLHCTRKMSAGEAPVFWPYSVPASHGTPGLLAGSTTSFRS